MLPDESMGRKAFLDGPHSSWTKPDTPRRQSHWTPWRACPARDHRARCRLHPARGRHRRYFAGRAPASPGQGEEDAVIATNPAPPRGPRRGQRASRTKSEELRQTVERMQREYTRTATGEPQSVLLLSCLRRDGLRQQLASYASGGVEASRDSSKPVVIEPMPSGGYWSAWCNGYAVCRSS